MLLKINLDTKISRESIHIFIGREVGGVSVSFLSSIGDIVQIHQQTDRFVDFLFHGNIKSDIFICVPVYLLTIIPIALNLAARLPIQKFC